MHTIVLNAPLADSPEDDDNDPPPVRRGRSKVNPVAVLSTYAMYELATKYLLPSCDEEDPPDLSVIPTPPPSHPSSPIPPTVPVNHSIQANGEEERSKGKGSEETKQTEQTEQTEQKEQSGGSNCPELIPSEQINTPMERKESSASKESKEPITSEQTPTPAVKAKESNEPKKANEVSASSEPQHPAPAPSSSTQPPAPPAPEDDVHAMYQAALLFLYSYNSVKSNVPSINEPEPQTEAKAEDVVLCAPSPGTASVESVPDATRPATLIEPSGISPNPNPEDSIAGIPIALDIKSESDKPQVAQGAQLVQSEHSPSDAPDAYDALNATREGLTTSIGVISPNTRISLPVIGTGNKLNGAPCPSPKRKSVPEPILPPSPSPEPALLPGLFRHSGSSVLALGMPPNAPKLKPAALPSPERYEEFEPMQLTPPDDAALEDEWPEELMRGDLLLEAYWARAEEEDRSVLSSTDVSDEDELESCMRTITRTYTRPITRQEYVHPDDEEDDTSETSDTLCHDHDHDHDRDHYLSLDKNDRLTPTTLDRVDSEKCTLSGGPHQPGDIVSGLKIDMLSSHCHTVNGRLLQCGQLSCGCVIPVSQCGPMCTKCDEIRQTTGGKEGREGTLLCKGKDKSKKGQDVWFCPCALFFDGVEEDQGNMLFCPFYIDNSDDSKKKRSLELDSSSLEQERNQHLWEDHNLGKCTHKLTEHPGGTIVRSNQLRRYHEVKDHGVHFVRATTKGKKCAVTEEKMIAELQCGCIIDVPLNTSVKHPLFCVDCKKRQMESEGRDKAAKSPKAMFSFRKKRPVVTLCNKVRLGDLV
jgi:hypothetical protein